MITSNGMMCDVCGKYILLDNYQPFSVKGCNQELHCHAGVCKAQLEDAAEDWHELPEGPLREAFEEANA